MIDLSRRRLLGYGAAALAGTAFTVPAAIAQRILPFSGAYLNVMQYGAVGDGVTDDAAAIQAAINACQTAGGGTVIFPTPTGFYGVKSTITWKPGVYLQGMVGAPGYFDGWDGYLNSANTGVTCRIKAIATWGSGDASLMLCDASDTTNAARGKGYGGGNIIFDGNNLTSQVITYSGAGFIERFLTLDNCTILRSGGVGVRDNINVTNLMLRMTRCNVFSSARYGVWLGPITDSFMEDNYIHSNTTGGIYNSNGGLNQVKGGKIEENFGFGILAENNTAGLCSMHIIGVDFQHNTASGIKCGGNTQGGGGGAGLTLMKADACFFAQNGYTNTLGPGGQLFDDSNGRIVADACTFYAGGVSPYHLSSTNSGKLWHRNSAYQDAALTASTFTATSGVITADGGLISNIN